MFKNIAIVGLGVMGGSFAKTLHHVFPNLPIAAIETNENSLNEALKEGVIFKGEKVNQTILQQADLVIFTLYPHQLKPFMEENQGNFKSGALLTDVTGVKQKIIEGILPLIPKNVSFLFGHPMAGRESQGYAFGSESIFTNANYLFVETNTFDPILVEEYLQLVKDLGFSKITWTTPLEHDSSIAYTSQLPHVIAVSLINASRHPEKFMNYTGDSFKELTRIAKINGPLWEELFFNNKEELLKRIHEFEKELDILKNAITNEDSPLLLEKLGEAKTRRLAFEKGRKLR